jgi:hypothetical protein
MRHVNLVSGLRDLSSLFCSSKDPQIRGWQRFIKPAWLAVLLATGNLCCVAQNSAPFVVSNPKNLKWPMAEASRIYYSACYLAARTVRPEKPPQLNPKFVLVLGTATDETIRNGAISEIHLTKWDRANFAAAVAMMATREIVTDKDLLNIVREALLSAQAQVSVNELRSGK